MPRHSSQVRHTLESYLNVPRSLHCVWAEDASEHLRLVAADGVQSTVAAAQDAVAGFVDSVKGAASGLRDSGKSGGSELSSGLGDAKSGLLQSTGSLREAADSGLSAAQSTASGLLDGVTGATGGVQGQAAQLLSSVQAATADLQASASSAASNAVGETLTTHTECTRLHDLSALCLSHIQARALTLGVPCPRRCTASPGPGGSGAGKGGRRAGCIAGVAPGGLQPRRGKGGSCATAGCATPADGGRTIWRIQRPAAAIRGLQHPAGDRVWDHCAVTAPSHGCGVPCGIWACEPLTHPLLASG